MARQSTKRKDKDRIVLRKGECQRPNGSYGYRWTDQFGKRHVIYGKTLEELRAKEKEVDRDISDGIKAEKRNTTINELFDLWCHIKRGLKDNTFQNYKYMYNTFVRPKFGKLKISQVKKSDVKRFYNYWQMNEACRLPPLIASIPCCIRYLIWRLTTGTSEVTPRREF